MKTALITGSTGALASAVIARLRQTQAFRVVETSRQADAHRLDIRDDKRVEAMLAEIRPDIVFHLAATFSGNYDEAYAVNVDATRRLLDLVEHSHPQTRVLLVGSAAEYGAVEPGDNPIREDHVLNPQSIYGLSKSWQTQLASFYALRGVSVVVARLFNLEAPGLSERLFIGRVQKQIEEVRKGQRSSFEFGPLNATRDYVDADEAARQMLAIAIGGTSGQIYNVGSGKPIVMRELLQRLLAAQSMSTIAVQEAPALTNRAGYDVPVIYADMCKTLSLLGESIQK
ncbi:GDP-4-dehydro-6-deoxy-D-mannose reductase [Variovorax sp. OK605]|uniref:NAD-dependent epimerase/dehydratase family protein n=1 Tax=Variovorax sp. OK605 TaxID=1855317 RepID=UPI0008F10FFD|nr:NAD-dependent epimerase/dehydratase family protein [Variovorax sp. OK605]SFO97759.1 GDP-4-dehydro-6-deoxy-D-mannose reductase [Variovorax sp. OK605]